jgi:molybdenum cofactor guanylyltransferase
MGRDKAWLPFGEEVMLQRVVRLLGELVPPENIVVVAGVDQRLPGLPAGVRVVRDETPDQGPLPAVIRGLGSLENQADAAYVTACDAPLLKTAVIERLFSKLTSTGPAAKQLCEAIIPAEPARLYPMSSVYTTMCCSALRAAMEYDAAASDSRSVQAALRSGLISLKEVSLDELRALDPELDSLRNCNTPDEYQAALQLAGLAV